MRRDGSRRRDDGGFTLVELAVTMMLASIVLAITVTVFSTSENSASSTQQRFTATADAETAMQVVTQAVRAALPTTTSTDTQNSVTFVTAAADTLSFYASFGPAPTLVTFKTQPVGNGAYDELLESEVPAGGSAPAYTFTAAPKTTVVAFWLSPTAANASGAIFQYFTAGSTTPLSSPGSSLTSISSIEVTITCSAGSNQQEATMESMVYPPNLANANGVLGI